MTAQDIEILYEDNHLIAVNKPPGIPSQGDETGDASVFDIVKEYLRVSGNKQGNVYCGLLHRLDRPVGGVIVLAKTGKAAERMSKLFHDRGVTKVYYAVTEKVPVPAEGMLRHYLLKAGGKNIVKAFKKEVAHSQLAELEYKVLHTHEGKALVEVRPRTGRRHQIRAQLAAITCVIRGDGKYGAPTFNPDKSICLLARSITFPHPVKEKGTITITAPLPQVEWWQPFASQAGA